jgi:hypothetical protein
MTQNFDLNKMGLVPMTGEEMEEIDGGLFGIDDLVIIGIGLLVTAVYEMGKSYGAKLARGEVK